MQRELMEDKDAVKGKIYGRLTLTGRSTMKSAYGQLRRYVEADCICGEVGWFLFKRLKEGETKSCGCLRRDVARERMTTHGLKNHPLYDVYYAMLGRCYLENNESYKNYGARGITVCDEWQESFLNFYDWAVSNGYEVGKSIERENNDGNYEPKNCHFATRSVQNRNNRRNKMITAFGETKCLFDWAKDERCKVTSWALRSRFDRGRWTNMEEMISSPDVERKGKTFKKKTDYEITAFGETKNMKEWLKDERCVMGIDGLRDRLKNDWNPEEALTTPSRTINKTPVIESARFQKVDS